MPKLATRAEPAVIRIVVVAPQPLVRASLRDIFGWDDDVRIVRELADLEAAIRYVRDNPVDVVLVDTQPAISGYVPTLQRLKRECPSSPVVVIGHRQDDSELFGAVVAGAAAHVLDVDRPTELVRIIRAVAAGECLIDATVAARPTVARRVIEAFREVNLAQRPWEPADVEPPVERLTARELEVLTAMSWGMPNEEIAAAFSISPQMVDNSVQDSLRKLAVNNRTEAVLIALRQGWIDVAD